MHNMLYELTNAITHLRRAEISGCIRMNFVSGSRMYYRYLSNACLRESYIERSKIHEAT